MTDLSSLSGAAIGELVLILGGLVVAIRILITSARRSESLARRSRGGQGQDRAEALKSSTITEE